MIIIENHTYSVSEFLSLANNNKLFPGLSSFINEWESFNPEITLQTSGSTGIPKKIQTKKTHLVNSAKATCDFFKLNPKDKILICLPLNFIAGKMMVIRAVTHNLHMYLVSPASNPVRNLTEYVNFAAMTPHQVHTVIEENPEKLNLIEKLIIGGSSIDNELIYRLKQRKINAWATFGMTETYSHIALRKISPIEATFYTCLPHINVSLSTEETLIIHAPQLGHEALQTNDVVELINETSFRWKGRKDFVINSGGIKLHPESLEEKLAPHMNKPFFMGGIADEKLGEKIVLVIESDESDNKKDVIENLIASVYNSIEKPKIIKFVSHFVRTPSGKINRPKTLALIND
ncbi:MAG: AMP-binding protein [Flavobacteriales bacterium]